MPIRLSKVEAAQMGIAGRARAEQLFDAKAHLNKLVPIYQELSDQR